MTLNYVIYITDAVMPEGEKHWGGPVVIGEDNLPSLFRIGLTDLQNIGGPLLLSLAKADSDNLMSIY